jgi:ABC-type glycerol-3-phosphate transport system permease component
MSFLEPYRGWKRVLFYAFLVVVVVWVLFPFFWAVENSFKNTLQTSVRGSFFPWLQFQPTLVSWHEVLDDPDSINALLNSIFISLGATVLVLLLGTPAAYALARYEFRPMTSRDIAVWFLTQRALPPAVVLVPYFVLMVNLRLIDTRPGLILVYVAATLPFGVVIMRDIFRDIPLEIEEAAFIDGAGDFRVFSRINLPLAINGLVSTAIIVFAFNWNETILASTLTSRAAQTLPFFILSSRSTRGVDFNIAAVNTLIAIVPPVVLSLVIQRFLARGLTFGAVKG